MEMMKGLKELLESVINNKNILEEENRVLSLQEKNISEKLDEETKNINTYNYNVIEYNKLKKSEKKKLLINIGEITCIGLLILVLTNFLDNDVQTIGQVLNSTETIFASIFAGLGNSIILVDTINTIKTFKKENIDIYNIEEMEKNRNKYFNDLQKVRSDISITNEALNIFDRRIEELSKNQDYTNTYENINEKPVQKKKI